ncbi:GAF domain-containing protein [bacterium]|nr:GAF domain-containing protein [bacterium]
MTTHNSQNKKSDYIRKVSVETMELMKQLFHENEQLNKQVILQETEIKRFSEVLKKIRDLETEIERLQGLVISITQENTQLKDTVRKQGEDISYYKVEREKLLRNLETIESRHKEFFDQIALIEKQNTDLANLYVASFQIHGTLVKQELLTALKEIIINLIGSEEFGIFLHNEQEGSMSLLDHFGKEAEQYSLVDFEQSVVGQTIRSGETYINQDFGVEAEASPVVACIPFKFEDCISGAIIIFRLLQQKKKLEDLDFELFNLLATHAAKALYCIELHDHKVRTDKGVRLEE